MKEYELSRDDFILIDVAFNALQRTADLPTWRIDRLRADTLQNRFAKAHTAWLELEDD